MRRPRSVEMPIRCGCSHGGPFWGKRRSSLDGFDATAGLRLYDVRFLTGGAIGAARGCDVEADLATRRPWSVANMVDAQCQSLLGLKRPLRQAVLLENVTWQLALQYRAQLTPAK